MQPDKVASLILLFMCILIVKPAKVRLPDYATLCRCADRNPDGFGFAVPEKTFKSLSFDTFIKRLSEADEDLPMLIHFRRATHGSIRQSNCHPFRDRESGISFAHNGVLHIQNMTDKTDSETAFRLLFLPAIETFGFDTAKSNKAIESIIGSSKFAFLTDKGTIKTYGNFIKENGCLFSNTGYRPRY